MSDGWIKLHRKIKDWGWYKNPIVSRVFFNLLLSVNHKDGYFEGIFIPRGSLICTQESLSQDLKLSRQNIRTALKNLSSTGEISQKLTEKGTLITICNFDTYSDAENKTNQRLTRDQPETNQRLTRDQPETNHKQEDKNGRNKEDKNIKKKNSKKKKFDEYSELNQNRLAEKSDRFNFTFQKFIEMRNENKKPPTDYALHCILNDLDKISCDETDQIDSLLQSIKRNYTGVFEVKKYDNKKSKEIYKPKFNSKGELE